MNVTASDSSLFCCQKMKPDVTRDWTWGEGRGRGVNERADV